MNGKVPKANLENRTNTLNKDGILAIHNCVHLHPAGPGPVTRFNMAATLVREIMHPYAYVGLGSTLILPFPTVFNNAFGAEPIQRPMLCKGWKEEVCA
jgi:hypothetical protein